MEKPPGEPGAVPGSCFRLAVGIAGPPSSWSPDSGLQALRKAVAEVGSQGNAFSMSAPQRVNNKDLGRKQ